MRLNKGSRGAFARRSDGNPSYPPPPRKLRVKVQWLDIDRRLKTTEHLGVVRWEHADGALTISSNVDTHIYPKGSWVHAHAKTEEAS